MEEDENDRRKEIGLIKNQLQKVFLILNYLIHCRRRYRGEMIFKNNDTLISTLGEGRIKESS